MPESEHHNKDFLSVQNIGKNFPHHNGEVSVLDNVSFSVSRGETLAICGPSGAGKSTLLNLLGGLDTPSTGDIILRGQSLQQLSDGQRATLRNRFLGFVFQFHHLLRDFTVLENVALPLLLQKVSVSSAQQQAKDMLARVGVVDKDARSPLELSGGEQQRVAIARALVTRPELILADEPTGNLDEVNGLKVFDLLCEINRDLGSTLIVVTHHAGFARKMQRILQLEQGALQKIETTKP